MIWWVGFVVSLALGQPLGSGGLEPQLKSRSDLFFFDNFDSSGWYRFWGENSLPQNCSLVTAPVFDGTSALRVHVPQASHYGTSFSFRFASEGLPEPEELYFRYYVNFGNNWRQNNSEVGKLPGFGGTYGRAGWGGRKVNGYDGWSARMMNHDRGSRVLVGFYCYHVDMAGTYGEHMGWTRDSLGYLTRNQWHCIEAYVKLNTPGQNNGILRGFVNGDTAFSRANIRFRDTTALKVEEAWFDIYVGGSWTAPQDMDVYFDNAVVARNYVGPKPAVGVESPSRLDPLAPQAFPNPITAGGFLRLFPGGPAFPRYRLYRPDGRLAVIGSGAAPAPGLYFAVLRGGQTRVVRKIVVIP